MKVEVQEIDTSKEEEVLIHCHKVNEKILSIISFIKNEDQTIQCSKEGNIFTIRIKDIYYIESLDNKTFVYLKNDLYESKLKLYEFESVLEATMFFRCSKSMIANCKKIKCVRQSVNGRFDATLLNDEKIMISRQYVPILKKKLGL